MDEFQEILQDFLVESFELIEQLDQDLVELESRPDDLDLLNRIFRVAHTIKGASSFLNFDVLTHLTHHMENLLNMARHGDLVIDANVMDVILESIDLMKALLVRIRDSGEDGGLDVAGCVARLDAVANGKPMENAAPVAEPAPQPEPVAPVTSSVEEDEPDYSGMSDAEVEAEIERLLAKRQAEDAAKRANAKPQTSSVSEEDEPNYEGMSDAEVEAEIERLLAKRQAEDAAKRANKSSAEETPAPAAPAAAVVPVTPTPAPQAEAAPQPKPAAAPVARRSEAKEEGDGARGAAAVEQTIRVDVKRLDHLMNLIGELVLGKNRLIKINDDVEERYEGEAFLEELNQVVSIVSLVTTDLQIAVMKTRMLPIGKVFNKFPRMIRDLSRELNKKIELEITGEDTELDKSIVEEIGDPL
ncbi:MAG: Hpt domain-containing protein, partial [Sulfuricurvum sp.]|nr:Hpt domain-containing protein [Sulfuricurvum sp.]